MAGILMRQWGLAVLKVRLDLSATVPAVTSELVAYPDGTEERFWSRVDPLMSFGVTSATAPPAHLELPRALAAAVDDSLHGELQGQASLWLRLVPPYGYLGAVPWEDLVPLIGVPLLRVPDRLPVPVDFGTSWSAALAVSAPPGATWGAEHVRRRVEGLRRYLTVPLQLDVFADAHTHALLTDDPTFEAGPDVRLHEPDRAISAHEERADVRAKQDLHVQAARRPFASANLLWADWMISGLGGRAVRALHLATPGALDGIRPVLRFSTNPGRSGRTPWAVGTDDDVCQLADVLGASLVTFSSPPTRHSDLAIRMLADGIGQSRPGPTLYSSMAGDPTGDALASAEAFLAAPHDALPVPQHPSVFGYIQPEAAHPSLSGRWLPAASDSVYGTVGVDAPSPDELVVRRSMSAPSDAALDLGELYGPGEIVPSWVASSARFIDTQRAALMSVAKTAGEPVATRRAYDEGAASALAEIQELVFRSAEELK
ncbi:MAG: hypothetical protein ACOH2F_04920 [Cellulomonas sp.]